MPGAVLLAGPTASGKSRLALALARDLGGVVVNADSMQVYRELSVLTARPRPADEAGVPHRLYGHVPAAERYSVGRWLADVAAVLEEARDAGRVPIVAGGTGLYFRTLTDGLSTIPPVPDDVRGRIAREAGPMSAAALHVRLARVAPDDAGRIRPSDRGRIVRALEVVAATGRSLASWHAEGATPLLAASAIRSRIVLMPERAELHRRIVRRTGEMLAGGAVEEVRSLIALGLEPTLPAMKAIGVRDIAAYLDGRLTLSEAEAAMGTETRRYARRQATWFRSQMATGWSFVADERAALDAVGASA